MLYITFNAPDDLIYDIDGYFQALHAYHYLTDEYCKKIVKDIDKSDVISENLIISPVLGPIPPDYLSGGAKELILAYKTDKFIDGNNLGENCLHWLIDIARTKDVKVYFGWLAEFGDLHFDFIWEDKCLELHDYFEFLLAFSCSTGMFGEEEFYAELADNRHTRQ